MIRAFDRILKKYGQAVKIGEVTVRAFFQPAADSEKNEPFSMTAMGAADDRKWIYLGEKKVCLGTSIVFQGHPYTVRNCTDVRVGNETAYWWAVATKEGEAAT